MDHLTTEQLQKMLLKVSEKIIISEPLLMELDTIIGDGDHGFGMRTGFSAVAAQLSEKTYASPYELFKDSGMTLIRVMGGTSGVIFGTLFIGGLSAMEGKETLSVQDFADYISLGTQSIARRGRTARGDKTMYDALIEASESLLASASSKESFETAFQKACEAAKYGVENTKSMLSKKGRSKNFKDKTLGHPDTGAVSVSLIFEAFHETIC